MATSQSGPGLPRYQLGRELARLRNAKGLSSDDVAVGLRCSASKIRRMEAGSTGPSLAELEKLLDIYGVDDPDYRNALLDLQEQGRQRGWWSKFGRLPESATKFLGFESAATQIRVFEPILVPGLLQTEAYAQVVFTATPRVSQEDVERWVRLRLSRQAKILQSGTPPDLWFILDESAIRREVGGPLVLAEQLGALLDGPFSERIQIVPAAVGVHPGVSGGFTIFDFESGTRPSVVHVESQAGDLCLDDLPDVDRCTVSYDRLRSVALSPAESHVLISTVIEELKA